MQINRERRALVAFVLLGAAVLAPLGATATHGSAGAARSVGGSHRASPTGSARGDTTTGGSASGHSRFPNRKGPTPLLSMCGVSVPLYPGARRGGAVGAEGRIVAAVTRLGRTDPLSRFRVFTMKGSDWLGNSRTPEDVFQFYLRRMHEVQIWRMGSALRSLLGLRARGEVDSPPLLYLGDRSAVVVRSTSRGGLGLIVAVACTRTV